MQCINPAAIPPGYKAGRDDSDTGASMIQICYVSQAGSAVQGFTCTLTEVTVPSNLKGRRSM